MWMQITDQVHPLFMHMTVQAETHIGFLEAFQKCIFFHLIGTTRGVMPEGYPQNRGIRCKPIVLRDCAICSSARVRQYAKVR